MKRLEIIRMTILVSLIIIGNCVPKSHSSSPMDRYEAKMKEDYKFHNIAGLTNYILKNRESGKSEFDLGKHTYKMKVNRHSRRAEYDDYLLFEVKLIGDNGKTKCIYNYDMKKSKVTMWSDKLDYLAYYDFDKKELSIRTIKSRFNEFKMYGYDYTFKNTSLVKVQDWVIRDAIGRANSIN